MKSTVFKVSLVVVLVAVGLAFFMTACGNSAETSSPTPPTPTTTDPAFIALQPVLKRACGECHNGVDERAFDSPSRLKGSSAKARILNGSMPAGGRRLATSDKKALLDYLN